MSASGTNPLYEPARSHFRCWRLTGRGDGGIRPSQFDPQRTLGGGAGTGSASRAGYSIRIEYFRAKRADYYTIGACCTAWAHR